MKRINEALSVRAVLAPQSVAASTEKTSAYVDLSGVEEAVKFQHDGSAAVVCGVTVAVDGLWLPAGNGWTLVV